MYHSLCLLVFLKQTIQTCPLNITEELLKSDVQKFSFKMKISEIPNNKGVIWRLVFPTISKEVNLKISIQNPESENSPQVFNSEFQTEYPVP